MRVHIQYPVVTRGAPARATKEKTCLFSDSGTFDLAEYSSREVVRAAHSPHEADSQIVWLDGSLYEEIATASQMGSHDFWRFRFWPLRQGFHFSSPWASFYKEQRAELQQAFYDNGRNSIYPDDIMAVAAGRETVVAPKQVDRHSFKKLDETAFSAARRNMADESARMIVVGGALMRKCHAPLVSYEPVNWATVNKAIDLRFVRSAHFFNMEERVEKMGSNPKLVFDCSDMGEGMAVAEDIVARVPGSTRDQLRLRTSHDHLVVEAPELLLADSASFGILQCARSASMRIAQRLTAPKGKHDEGAVTSERILDRIAEVDQSDLLLLSGLVKGVRRANATGVDDELADLVRIAARNPMSHLPAAPMEYGTMVMEACIDRWDNQRISVPSSFPQPTGPRPR